MADSEQNSSEPTSPFWARVKIVMGFAPAIVALGTAVTAIVKTYDQSSQKAIYETLSKKVEENSAAIQDTHSDVKAVWAYLNGMAVGKATAPIDSAPTVPLTPPLKPTTQAKPKNSYLELARRFEKPPTQSTEVDQDGVSDPEDPEPKAQPTAPQKAALPDLSPAPKADRLPSFEDVIERPKAKY